MTQWPTMANLNEYAVLFQFKLAMKYLHSDALWHMGGEEPPSSSLVSSTPAVR